MTVQAVNDYYYTPVQSTADYSSSRRAAEATDGTGQVQRAQEGPDDRNRQQEQAVKLYFFDGNLGQYVNLLV